METTVNTHCTRKILGHSVQNRPVEAYFFGTPEPDMVDTLFIGAFHGDEGISAQLLERMIARWQCGEYAGGTAINFTDRAIVVLPVLNPDGLAVETRMNANGVDLNRNYPTPNWIEENQKTIYYSGKSAASEPETLLLIGFIEKYKPKKIVTVHSPYKVINFDGPARELAEAMAAHSRYAIVEDIGYPTPGSFGTYAGKIRKIPVVTLELPEDETLDTVWQDNAISLEAAALFG